MPKPAEEVSDKPPTSPTVRMPTHKDGSIA